MKLISRLRDERYCAFCRSPRRLYVKKHIDLTNVAGVALVSLLCTYALWGEPDPRGLVLFCVLMGAGEVFVYMRWRSAVVCRMCGFDPVVYKSSPERAAELVNRFFTEQAKNPGFWLSKSPLVELHRRQREIERRRLELEAVRKFVNERSLAKSVAARPSPEAARRLDVSR